MKVIEMPPWDVMKEVATNGKRFAIKTSTGNWQAPSDNSRYTDIINWLVEGHGVALIDDSIPYVDWNDFDWTFFNQYGGIQILFGDLKQYIMHPSKKERQLCTSPFYHWPGGKCPTPPNVEIEVILRNGHRHTDRADYWDEAWDDGTMYPSTDSDRDIIAFRLTGEVR